MNSERYMKIVVDIFLFLELTSDDAIDADTAVQEMESIAADLDQLDVDAKRRFKHYLAGRALAAKSEQEAETIEALSDAISDASDGPSASVRDSHENEMTMYSQIIVDSLLFLRLNDEPFVSKGYGRSDDRFDQEGLASPRPRWNKAARPALRASCRANIFRRRAKRDPGLCPRAVLGHRVIGRAEMISNETMHSI